MAPTTQANNTPFKILLGRLLTRSGDQAWDFAVPLTLLKIFPDQIRIAARHPNFSILVAGSVGFVILGAIIFSSWKTPKFD